MTMNEMPSLHPQGSADQAPDSSNSENAGAKLVFEVTGAGFDGGTDETDDRVLWVVADNERQVIDAIADCGAAFCGEIHEDCKANVDFELPRQIRDLQVKLLGWTSHLDRAQPPATVYVAMEQNDDGIGGKVFASRAGAEQHLREVLAEYESGGDPVFTDEEIEVEIARIRENPDQADTIVASDLGTLWIDVCPVNP